MKLVIFIFLLYIEPHELNQSHKNFFVISSSHPVNSLKMTIIKAC